MTCPRCEGYLVLRELHLTFLEYFCIACNRETIVKVPEDEIVKRKKEARERQVQRVVKEYGVNSTAERLDVPRSTVVLSTKPKWSFYTDKYTKEFKTEVAEYAIRAKNYYWSAKKFKISRGSIQNWVKEYKQHGGEGWLSKNHT